MNDSIFSKIRWPRPFVGLRGITLAVPVPFIVGLALSRFLGTRAVGKTSAGVAAGFSIESTK